MNVAELIEALQQQDPASDVVVLVVGEDMITSVSSVQPDDEFGFVIVA